MEGDKCSHFLFNAKDLLGSSPFSRHAFLKYILEGRYGCNGYGTWRQGFGSVIGRLRSKQIYEKFSLSMPTASGANF